MTVRSCAAFGANLLAGLRLALLLPVAARDFRPTLGQGLSLFLLSAFLTFSYDWYLAGAGAEFSIAGLYYQALLYLLFFLSIVLMAALAGGAASVLPLTVQVLAVAPTTLGVYTLCTSLLGWLPENVAAIAFDWMTPVYLAWYLLVVLRAIRLELGPTPLRGALLLILYGACNVLPWVYLPPEPLWLEAAVETDAPREAPDVERLFFRQHDLLERSVAGLEAQRPGVVDVYFIGVAGFSGEDVFLNEAQQAARVFTRDFDAAGRALLLVNNPQTYERLPLASRDNLADALSAVGRTMDPDEDLLVLFMTSHGEEGQGLVLDLDGFPLEGISPRSLRLAMDGAGIRHRAVIVSACFSGGFLDEFRDPRSLVMTSARRDRSSFGCGHDGPFTYFGAAFLGNELPRDGALVQAFERARDAIRAREEEEGLTPSEPQLWVGAELRDLLERLAVRLRSAKPPAESPRPPREALSRGEPPARAQPAG